MKTPTAHARSLLLHLLIASLLTTMETLQMPTVEPTSPVLFQYVGEAQVTYRDWMLIVPVNFTQYGTMIDRVEEEVTLFEEAMTRITEQYEDTTYHPKLLSENATQPPLIHAHTLSIVKTQMRQYKEEIRQLRGLYRELREGFLAPPGETPSSRVTRRTERSLVPSWMTLGFEYLTGLTSKERVDTLRQRIRVLSTNARVVASAMDTGLTLLNTTVIHAKENRKSINHLTEAVQAMETTFGNVERNIRSWMTDSHAMMTTFNGVILAMDAATSLIRRCHGALQTLRSQMQTAILGRYPWDLLTKEDIEKFSDHLRDELTGTYALPYKTDELQQLLYQLPTVVVGDDNAVQILIKMPLSQNDDLYNMYVIAPVPLPEVVNGTAKQYELEAAALAVTPDNTYYRIITPEVAIQCGAERIRHCTLSGPSYKVIDSPLCVISLFTKDKEATSKICRLENIRPPTVPLLRDMGKGQWLMFSTKPERLYLQCLEDTSRQPEPVDIPEGTHLISLPPGCRANGRTFRLSAYINKETEIQLAQIDKAVTDFHDSDWSTFVRSPPLIQPTITRDISGIKLPPLDEYTEAIRHHMDYVKADLRTVIDRNTKEDNYTAPVKGLLIGVTIIAAVIILIAVITLCMTEQMRVKYGRRIGIIRSPPATDAEKQQLRAAFPLIRGEQTYQPGEMRSAPKKRKVEPTAPPLEMTIRSPPPLPGERNARSSQNHDGYIGMCTVTLGSDDDPPYVQTVTCGHGGPEVESTLTENTQENAPSAEFLNYLRLRPVHTTPCDKEEGQDDIPYPKFSRSSDRRTVCPLDVDEALRRLLDTEQAPGEPMDASTPKTTTSVYPTTSTDTETSMEEISLPTEMPALDHSCLRMACQSPLTTNETVTKWLNDQPFTPINQPIDDAKPQPLAVEQERRDTPHPESESPDSYPSDDSMEEDPATSQQRRVVRIMRKLDRPNRPPKLHFGDKGTSHNLIPTTTTPETLTASTPIPEETHFSDEESNPGLNRKYPTSRSLPEDAREQPTL